MPQRKSAKEELKKSLGRKSLNLAKKRAIKTAVKTLKKSLQQDDLKVSEAALREVYTTLDKAASKKVIHANKAARKKSRFSALLTKKQASKK
jgi:small subunit ribosomal protein S20